MAEYNFRKIEQKWQTYWMENESYKVEINPKKPKYYILDMFPYPSGAGLHVGHPLGYIATDIVARYKRLKGFNVLHPMGFDSFGLPAEQYAIQTGQHPAKTTEQNIARYKEQLIGLGLSYDWSREIRTSSPDFYQWTQWIFKKLFNAWYDHDADKAKPIESLVQVFEKQGNRNLNAACDEDTPRFTSRRWAALPEEEKEAILLRYRLTYIAETNVNWCPALGTVLSNDEVKDGFSERGGHPVVIRKMRQWHMRITAYAERLLRGLDTIDWPASVKEMQRNWIGKSTGAQIAFAIAGHAEKISVFTTRIDTIYGVTFLTLAPEHELVSKITKQSQKAEVTAYVHQAVNRPERERMSDIKHITGVFTGAYAIHPFHGEKIPIWIADYVLAGYGTGAVMAVPSGDQRDYEFAKHFDLPIVPVYENMNIEHQADPTKEGKIINEGLLKGLTYEKATEKAISFAEENNIGTRKINYKIRNAVFGRQRYWGEPFPVYYDKNGKPKLLRDDQLPHELPEINQFLPTETGDPPLGRAEKWKTAEGFSYELTTMPGWAGSSWYFFRYMDPHNRQAFAGEDALAYWQDVDFYLGGPEHAIGHLLYSRFWTKFLFDMGYVPVDEYARKLINQGMIQGRSSLAYRVTGQNTYVSKGLIEAYNVSAVHVDVNLVKGDVLDVEAFQKSRPDAKNATYLLENGKFFCAGEVEKMSKSRQNVVNPDDLVKKYGADTLRMYEMFLGPIQQSKPWNTNGIEGVFRFLKKLWALFHDHDMNLSIDNEAEPTHAEYKILYATLKKAEEDIEKLSLNTVVSSFMIAVNQFTRLQTRKRAVLEPLVIVLSPYAPHICEELWSMLGNTRSVTQANFPEIKEQYLEEESHEYPVSVNGKMRVKIALPLSMTREEIETAILSDRVIQKWTAGKKPQKVIVVPKRIVNVVI